MAKSKISEDDLISLGSRLESFGLVARIEGPAWGTPTFRPLERGCRFIGYIHSVETGEKPAAKG
jgi:hypothetical protein